MCYIKYCTCRTKIVETDQIHPSIKITISQVLLIAMKIVMNKLLKKGVKEKEKIIVNLVHLIILDKFSRKDVSDAKEKPEIGKESNLVQKKMKNAVAVK